MHFIIGNAQSDLQIDINHSYEGASVWIMYAASDTS